MITHKNLYNKNWVFLYDKAVDTFCNGSLNTAKLINFVEILDYLIYTSKIIRTDRSCMFLLDVGRSGK